MPVKRVTDATDLPTEALRCAAAGRHLGFLDDPTVTPQSIGGWGKRDARLVTYRCHCDREKREVIDWDTGENLTRSAHYDGGTLTMEPISGHDARLILFRRYAQQPDQRRPIPTGARS